LLLVRPADAGLTALRSPAAGSAGWRRPHGAPLAPGVRSRMSGPPRV